MNRQHLRKGSVELSAAPVASGEHPIVSDFALPQLPANATN